MKMITSIIAIINNIDTWSVSTRMIWSIPTRIITAILLTMIFAIADYVIETREDKRIIQANGEGTIKHRRGWIIVFLSCLLVFTESIIIEV